MLEGAVDPLDIVLRYAFVMIARSTPAALLPCDLVVYDYEHLLVCG